MKINFSKNIFNINFFVFFILNFLLLALFYGPSLVNLFYVLLLTFFIYKLYSKEINLRFKLKSVATLQIIFCLYLILNSFLINNDNLIVYKSLFYFRFFMLAYLISKILDNKDYTIICISFAFLLCSVFLSVDIIYQTLTGRDIFGFEAGLCSYPQGSYEIDPSKCERFSGFFGSEYIAGSFLSTYGLFFLYVFFNKLKKNIYIIFSLIFCLILILLSIILSGERNAFLAVMIIFFFNLVFNQRIRKYLFSIIIIFILILPFSFKKFEHVKHRYVDWPISNFSKNYEQDGFTWEDSSKFLKFFLQTPWGAHYLTAYEIFIDNKLFGSGFKNFRNECKKNKYSYKNLNDKYEIQLKYTGCSTHPHNMYFEILTETGLVGFILFIMIIYSLVFHPYFKNSKYLRDKEIVIFTLSIVISILFPLKPTGSFSATIFSTNLWFFIGFYLYFVNNLNYKK